MPAHRSEPLLSTRAQHEVEHGRKLADDDPEVTWGWGTPAGRLRAARRAELIVRAGQLRPGTTVLEIGCGTGMFTETFAASGARMVALDISADLLAGASTRKLPPDRVRFLERRIEDCSLEDPEIAEWAQEGFDAVVGSSVLHHLELGPALASVTRLLRPGGRIAFAEPNLLNPQVFLERNVRGLFPYVSKDEWAIVRWSLSKRLTDTGFDEVEITPFDWLHPATPPFLIPGVLRGGRILESLPGLREFAGSVLIHGRRPRLARGVD